MSHKLFRLAKRYSNKPQLITQDEFDTVLEYLDGRNSGTIELQSVESKKSKSYSEGYYDEYYQVSGMGNIAVVTMQGVLTYKKTGFEAMCQSGISSYQEMKRVADHLASDSNIETVILEIDSGGGQAYGCFSAARYVKDTLNAAGKRIVAYVDGMACSAAYAWAAIADEIIINPLAEAGSVGVVVHLMDTSVAMQQAGLRSIYITAGDNKVPFDEDGAFKEEFLEEIQGDVDSLYERFVSFVSEMRGIPEDDVRATEASVYGAEEAISLGLVDRIMEIEDFYAELEVTDQVDYENPDRRESPPSVVDDGKIQGDKDEEDDDKKASSSNVNIKGEMMTDKVEETALETTAKVVENLEAGKDVTIEAVTSVPNVSLDATLSAEMAELKEMLENQKAELASIREAKEALEVADTQRKLEGFSMQAKSWAFAGVDDKAFAESALTGMVPVEMMTQALDKAAKSMETMSGMEELGVAETQPEKEEKVDGVTAALKASGKYKLKS